MYFFLPFRYEDSHCADQKLDDGMIGCLYGKTPADK